MPGAQAWPAGRQRADFQEVDKIARSDEEPTGRRRGVLRVLRGSRGALSIVEIADELGVHPNTVRFHLDNLVAAGQIERVEPVHRGPGRPPLMFRAVRQMDRGGPRHYRILAEILTIGLAAQRDSSAKALAAGRKWGQTLEAPAHPGDADESIQHLVGVLDEMGFAPERGMAEGTHTIGLRHCPFLELAEVRTNVVCPIHLGLMQGALETWEAPVTVERLEAFAEPDLCLAHLRPEGTLK
ncbi:helix-turn-helix transcriptional regulator [Mycobacterium szulgai]|uniref:helix-turn-helix transcriptional regulator n=1 Tax=Mycobacterium szulgai TaxID=1787 RepID=UPI000A1D84AD|nr:helix-turn-helix domain-containing protein [Mycobacterium szulgai]MCV7076571.1 helix-turn-helix domain-containing protein [Mycobacterium szulgai]